MLGWDHGGFSLDANVRIDAQDRSGLERLIRYCARPVFSGERLEWAGEESPIYSSQARSRRANSHAA